MIHQVMICKYGITIIRDDLQEKGDQGMDSSSGVDPIKIIWFCINQKPPPGGEK